MRTVSDGVRTSRSRAGLTSSVLHLGAGLCLVVAAALLVAGFLPEERPLDVPAWTDEMVDAVLVLDEELLDDIAAYRGPRRSVALLNLIIGVVLPSAIAVLIGTGRLARPVDRLARLPGLPLQVGATSAAIALLVSAARTPARAWAGIVHDGHWGFRTRSTSGWVLDHLLVVGSRALAVGVLAAVLTLLVRRFPDDWPARLTLLVALVGPAALMLHPVVVHPLLLPSAALPDGEHRDAVLEVVARSGREVDVVLGEASLRTTRRNAVATGLGPTERIVLHDTLLDLDAREVAAIAAHELAHLERRDPLRAALAPVPVVALVALLAQRALRRQRTSRNAASVSELRLFLVVVAGVLALEVVATPLTAGASRVIEHRTDVRSVALSEDPEAHVLLLMKFVTDGLAEPAPPRWTTILWATHPSPAERIRAVTGAASAPSTR